MNLTELYERIHSGENLRTEFKEWPLHPGDLAAEMVAFANADGGLLILGVNRQGKPVGLDDPDQVGQFVDNVAYQNCEPPLTVTQEMIRDETGNVIVAVQVPKGQLRPYRTNRGLYYVRTASGRRTPSRQELLRLFQATASLYYDETLLEQTSLTDLDELAWRELVEVVREQGFDATGLPRERLLVNWQLVRRADDGIHLTLAGALFLARHPQDFVPCAYISALRIPGVDIATEPVDQKRIEGRAIPMLEEAMRFLELHLLKPHHIRRLEPEIKPELPPEALREALVNALSHRDYTISSPIRLLVFDDRLEIRTPGRLPNTVTIESMKQGAHILRNPHIYNLFLRLGLVTDAGSGVPRIIRLKREAVGREPVLAVEESEFTLTLQRPAAEGYEYE